MMEHSLGSETFFDGVKSYIGNFSYRNAESDDLWRHISAETRKNPSVPAYVDVKTVMDTWTLKKGYPVVTLTRNYTDARGSASLTQVKRIFIYFFYYFFNLNI